jgi:REP element-mobilizing transposase RayT
MKHASFLLDAPLRVAVEDAISGVCDARGWELVAINVRTSHVHVVVAADQAPERMMSAFKAWSTRQMRQRGLMDEDAKAWSRHGSTRYLWTKQDVENACQYVVHGQGPPLSRA